MKRAILFIILLLGIGGLLHSQDNSQNETLPPGVTSVEPMPVILDHQPVFYLKTSYRGYPIERRVEDLSRRLELLAKDFTISVDSIRVEETRLGTEILVGDQILFITLDEDAIVEGRDRHAIAEERAELIKNAIIKFRRDYSRERIVLGIIYSLLATGLFALILFLLRRLDRKLMEKVRERISARYGDILEGPQGERVFDSVNTIRNFIRFGSLVILLAFYLQSVFSFLPWTRPFAQDVLGYVLGPLKILGTGFLAKVPDLIFLIVLALVTNFLLKAIRVFFNLIEVGRIHIQGFEPEWSRPTFNIIRIAVIAFALVVAFPYLPGSESSAFKGISVFVGLVFSLGSTSFIANIMAGLSLVYRRAFRIGDFVQVGDIRGEVISIRLTVTQIRTVKNETVTLPNSQIISGSVINFTMLAGKSGLILHTSVTIGYDVPWRQVHAMLLNAAEKTPHVLKNPQPFVLQQELQDFYVKYELNAYTDDSHKMGAAYSALHQNIQDTFNEYGVQIMSPNYEADPAEPKIVPREQWHKEPALPEDP